MYKKAYDNTLCTVQLKVCGGLDLLGGLARQPESQSLLQRRKLNGHEEICKDTKKRLGAEGMEVKKDNNASIHVDQPETKSRK